MAMRRDRNRRAGFEGRNAQGQALVNIILRHYWQVGRIRDGFGFRHRPNGYEHLVPEERRRELRERYDEAAMNIRFRPDALVVADGDADTHLFLEYKATTTPRYTFGEEQWDRGQIEADPWENYLRRVDDGQQLAILNYCSYHHHPLLCDFVKPEWQVSNRREVGYTEDGSWTDFYNTDLTLMRTFEQFMLDEFGVPIEVSLPLIRNALGAVLQHNRLKTRHAPKSPCYRDRRYYTSFNWEARYKPD